jgi:hypothetical protein
MTMSDIASGDASSEQVVLRASVTRSGETALVNLTFGNSGTEPLAIFDRPNEYKALRVPEAVGRHFSHVELLDEGAVLLGMIVPFPGTKSVEVSVVPCVTIVRPGNEVSHSATLPLPLDEFNSYYGVLPESATKLMKGSAVAVWVDYLWLGPGIKLVRDEKLGCERIEALPYNKVQRAKVSVGGVQIPIRKRFDRFHDGSK